MFFLISLAVLFYLHKTSTVVNTTGNENRKKRSNGHSYDIIRDKFNIHMYILY